MMEKDHPFLAALFKSKRAFIWRAFVLALVLRLIPVLLSFNLGIGLDDMFQYDMLARSIAAGEGYRWYAQADLNLIKPYLTFDLASVDYDPRGIVTAFRPPLYPAFLALIYAVIGTGARRFFIVRLVQAVIGAALVPLTYAVARRVFPEREKIAKWSALAVAFYPMLILYPLSLATENLFFVLFLGAALVLLRAAQTRRARDFALAGFMLGLAALTRSVSLAMGLLCVLWIWFALRERKSALITFALMLITIAPWMIRNAVVFGRPTIEMSMGYTLYMGYHPKSLGTFQYGISLDLMQMLDDAERDRIGIDAAKQFIADDPARVLILPIYRAGYFFGLERRALSYFYVNNFFGFIPLPILLTAAFILLMPFIVIITSAAFGFALIDWRRRETWLIATIVFGYIAPHLILLGEDRFHFTLIPFLAILAASCWSEGLPALKNLWRTRSGRVALLLAFAVCALLFFNWGYELVRDAEQIRCLLGPTGNQCFFPY
jgi:hypothetical protein